MRQNRFPPLLLKTTKIRGFKFNATEPLFCFEFNFLELKENRKSKYILVQWQPNMNQV